MIFRVPERNGERDTQFTLFLNPSSNRTPLSQANNACRQCMLTTSIEEATAWQECFDGYETGEAGGCADLTARICCMIEVSRNDACLTNELFMSYSDCYIGEECLPLPLMCGDATAAASTVEGNGAGRLSSPLLGVVGGGGTASAATVVMTMTFAMVAVAWV